MNPHTYTFLVVLTYGKKIKLFKLHKNGADCHLNIRMKLKKKNICDLA